ncbi:MAG: queuosine salvage family protein [Acidimicrobiia bacterium]
MTEAPPPLPERVRRGCAALAERAQLVLIDPPALDRLAGQLDPSAPEPFEEERFTGPPEHRSMAVVAWNAVNFGSGWFPHVRKLPGRSGARTLATRWHGHVDRHGVPDAGWLAAVTVEQVADVFVQPREGEVLGLLEAFAVAWRELGQHLLARHGGSAAAMVRSAGGSGAALAEELAGLSCWDDRHEVDGVEVPLHKRAQITVSHLGGFDDADRLTAFADNLVPHVLKVHGVLVVDPALDARIEREELLRSGERGEVELRALGVHAVELLVDRLRAAGHAGATAAAVDHRLWQAGQDPAVKARPRHRCRCTYY